MQKNRTFRPSSRKKALPSQRENSANSTLQTKEMKKLYIETYGCQMNVADSEVIAAIMDTAGYEVCDQMEDADMVLLNTCSIRDNAEQRIWGRLDNINALRRKNKGLLIGVVGCMAERVQEKLLNEYGCFLGYRGNRFGCGFISSDVPAKSQKRSEEEKQF